MRVQNTSLFQIWKEDHTFANLLREKLLEDDRVIFAGYRVPYPLENRYEVRVQAKIETEPKTCMVEALEHCRNEISECLEKFDEALQDVARPEADMDVDGPRY